MGRQLTTPVASDYVFGMASVSETEAVLVAAFLAGLLAIWGIITQRVVTRRATTLQLLFHNDSDKDLLEARNTFISLTSKEGGLAVLADPDKFTTEEAHAIRLVLNGHERLSLGMQFGILDREFVRRHSRGAILRDWTLAAPFIYKLRAEYKNRALYYEFEHLARSLEGYPMPKRSYRWRLWF